MGIVKQLRRKVIIPLVFQSGIPRLMAQRNSKKNLILNYHGVIQGPFQTINNRHLTTAQFEQDLQYLKKNYQIVSLQEMLSNSTDAKTPRVALTFDDGYRNNLRYALPLLKKYNAPATIYALGGSVTQSDYISFADYADLLFAASDVSGFQFMAHEFRRQPHGWYAAETPTLSFGEYVKTLGYERLEPFLKLMETTKPIGKFDEKYDDLWKLMSREELLECQGSSLVEVASHSVNHFNLGNVTKAVAARELRESKVILEDILQAKVEGLAYPDGHYDDGVKDLAEKAGYKYQMAVNYRCASDANDSRIRQRLSYSNSTTHASNFLRAQLKWNHFAW